MASPESSAAYAHAFDATCEVFNDLQGDIGNLGQNLNAQTRMEELIDELRHQGHSNLEVAQLVREAFTEYGTMQDDLQQGVGRL